MAYTKCITLSILLLFTLLGAANAEKLPATDVKRCAGNKPFPLEVRVAGCIKPPCIIYKGTVQVFEIDFVSHKFVTNVTALVKATTLGVITVPYELPDEVAAVCPNLMYGAYCPLYPTEDVTYYFEFPIGEYPEIGVKIEIYLVDQDHDIVTCFTCDIKVKKGVSGNKVAELN
ncbi:Npc2d [Drosophila busckii]|uniref:Npc2d n=1 Tax=Drosophila busckii TaxID=30019 RepID=A0A0M4EU07_DROBS|nr:uncharacterized protein LOC108602566 [Drosophila busckii]ALC46467.1 Npc2d [Drosophila busckii]